MDEKKKVIRVDGGSVKKPSDSNKKVVRRVVKVIDEKDLKNTNVQKEINSEIEKRRKQQEAAIKARIEKEEAERREKEQQRIIAERKKKEEEEKKRREEAERQKLIREAKKREEERRIAAAKLAEQKRKEEERLAREKAKAEEQERKRIEKEKATEKIRQLKEAQKEQRKNEREALKMKRIGIGARIWYITKIILVTGGITCASGACVLMMILYSWCKDIPTIDISELGKSATVSYIYDINGNLITTYSGVENREWVELKDMPQTLINAFVSNEDKRFYEHGAIDIKRLGKAILGQLTGNDDAGGSTITQQLIKNVYLTNEVTYKRKMQEIVLANQLEKQMTKDEILEAYLNIIYFGSSNYGVAAAARDYFDKSLDELTLREMAMLAGMPKNPNRYNPRRNTYVKNDMSSTNDRTDTVLWVMHNEGVISDLEYETALHQEVSIKEGSSFFEMYDYAHLVEYATQQVVADIIKQRGLDNTWENRVAIDNELRSGGYSIYTTIDPVAQSSMQETIQNWDNYPHILGADGNAIMNGEEYEKPQVASVIINPENGHILAMCGSRDIPTQMKTLNRAINSNMPVASTIKPLAIYAGCLENGLYPASLEYNFKTYIEGYDDKAAYPGGTSPEKAVTMREAIEQSYNVSAARFLVKNVGYELSEDYLIALGANKNDIQKNGSGLALGTSGIDMLELTAAYQTFANGGFYYEPKAYIKVVDNKGNEVINSSDYQEKRQVFSYETAWMMTDMLSSTVDAGNAKNAEIAGVQVAGKTGTHEDKCAVFAGYTGEYVSAIWVGSDAFSDLSDSYGGRQAAPIWQKYMSQIYEKKGIKKETVYTNTPNTIFKLTLCSMSGKLATDNCKDTYEEYAGYDIGYCDMHVEKTFCNYSGMIADSECSEDSCNTKVCTFIPADSSLASLPDEIIQKNWPGAIVESPENTCNAHASGTTIPTATQIGYAKSLVPKINTLLANTLLDEGNRALLTNDLASINNMIARAENALYNGVVESANFYGEYFAEYNRVKTDINNIQAALDNIAAQQAAQQEQARNEQENHIQPTVIESETIETAENTETPVQIVEPKPDDNTQSETQTTESQDSSEKQQDTTGQIVFDFNFGGAMLV